jgi:putative ABC transport system substrate-binding protein
MRRRDFITLLGGTVASSILWPLAARAQQDGRMRRVAVLALEEGPLVKAVLQELGEFGWIEGRNLRLDVRFGGGDSNRTRAYATELVKLAPDTIAAFGRPTIEPLLQETKTIPIIGVSGDFNDRGWVKNVARPEGNITGFSNTFGSLGGKKLELLKEAAPNIRRVAYLISANQITNAEVPYIVAAAQKLGVRIETIRVSNATDIKAAIERFAAEPNGALLLTLRLNIAPLELVRLAEQYRLPALYGEASWARDGGLMSYGSDTPYVRPLASYVDRILRGAKISDLPVIYATRFRLVVNLKTAKTIGLTIPESFLVRADEVIE